MPYYFYEILAELPLSFLPTGSWVLPYRSPSLPVTDQRNDQMSFTYMFEGCVRSRPGTCFFQIFSPVKVNFIQARTFLCQEKEKQNRRILILGQKMERHWPSSGHRKSLIQETD
jgi:hypothetical protein